MHHQSTATIALPDGGSSHTKDDEYLEEAKEEYEEEEETLEEAKADDAELDLASSLPDWRLVSDAETLDALKFLTTRMKLVAEPTGAITLAALLTGRMPTNCKRIGLLLCGGNA